MSSKKKKSSTSSRKITIKVATPDESRDPIVASFPVGIPEKCGQEDGPSFVWKESEQGKGKTLIGKDETNLYQAASTSKPRHDKRLTKLCVGIYNKKTATLTLHQAAERGTIFTMSQQVLGYQESSADLPSQMSGADRRRALFEAFGSSKKRKVLKSQAANVVNVDTVVGAGNLMAGALPGMSESNRRALEEQQSGTKTDAVEAAYAEARLKFLPPFDETAKSPHLVFDPRDIAGDLAWGQVSRVTDAVLARDENFAVALTSRGQWDESVQGVLRSIVPEGVNTKKQIKCAILLNHMIHFLRRTVNKRTLRGSNEELSKFLNLPIEVTSRFMDLFTTSLSDDRGQEQFALSKQTRDKCLVHIFLLNLMAHGNEMKATNIVPLSKDVKMERREASNLLRLAGCTVKSHGNEGVSAVLTVPLTFPSPKRGRGQS